jgi:hypothetical protein
MIRSMVVLSACALLGASMLAAKPKGKRAVFQSDHRSIIVTYYRTLPADLPPGLGNKGGLPPGLQKQLWQRGQLPPGLEKRIAPFPVALEHRLGPCPPGYQRGILDGRAILYDPRSATIVDSFVIAVNIGR